MVIMVYLQPGVICNFLTWTTCSTRVPGNMFQKLVLFSSKHRCSRAKGTRLDFVYLGHKGHNYWINFKVKFEILEHWRIVQTQRRVTWKALSRVFAVDRKKKENVGTRWSYRWPIMPCIGNVILSEIPKIHAAGKDVRLQGIDVSVVQHESLIEEGNVIWKLKLNWIKKKGGENADSMEIKF